MAYVPDATDETRPIGPDPVATLTAEIRALKQQVKSNTALIGAVAGGGGSPITLGNFATKNLYVGTGVPSAAIGVNGDVYFQYEI